MTDDALRNAENQRDQLLIEIDRMKSEVDVLVQRLAVANAFIKQWHDFAGDKPVEVVNNPGTVSRPDLVVGAAANSLAESTPRKKNSRKEEVAAAARKVIEEAGMPVMRAELFKILTSLGFVIDGTEPEMVLSTMLWRAGEAAGVTRLKNGGGYWLTEEDWAPARYFPSHARALDLGELGLREPVEVSADEKLAIDEEEAARRENPLLRGR
jgi:hypothetical protein